MATRDQKTGLLNTWKEIAAYLGRGVRTVQRWEAVGLPVRRLRSSRHAPVVADVRDIDNWLESAQAHGFTIRQSSEHLLLRGGLNASVQQAKLLRSELVLLRAARRTSQAKLISTIERLEKCCNHVEAAKDRRLSESEEPPTVSRLRRSLPAPQKTFRIHWHRNFTIAPRRI